MAKKKKGYPHLTLKYKKYGSMTDFRHVLNKKRISARKNGGFAFNYSLEQERIYISLPFENEIIHLNDNIFLDGI